MGFFVRATPFVQVLFFSGVTFVRALFCPRFPPYVRLDKVKAVPTIGRLEMYQAVRDVSGS